MIIFDNQIDCSCRKNKREALPSKEWKLGLDSWFLFIVSLCIQRNHVLTINPESRRTATKYYTFDILDFARGVWWNVIELIRIPLLLILLAFHFSLSLELINHHDFIWSLFIWIWRVCVQFFIIEYESLTVFWDCNQAIKLQTIHQLLLKSVIKFDALDWLFFYLLLQIFALKLSFLLFPRSYLFRFKVLSIVLGYCDIVNILSI